MQFNPVGTLVNMPNQEAEHPKLHGEGHGDDDRNFDVTADAINHIDATEELFNDYRSGSGEEESKGDEDSDDGNKEEERGKAIKKDEAESAAGSSMVLQIRIQDAKFS